MRERLRSSLWLTPALACALAISAATGALWIDEHVLSKRPESVLLGRDPESARELVSTVASSMLTFTGVVFSVTVLVLQLTSQQFSSRVLREFLQDRVTQVALATFIGTFAFALRVLPSIESGTGTAFVPVAATSLLLVLVLVSVGVFLAYIDHMAHAIRVAWIIQRVAEEGRRSVNHCYPDTESEPSERRADSEMPARPTGAPSLVATNDSSPGIVSHVHEKHLVELSKEFDVVIEVLPMVGDFVPRETETFRVWGARPPPPDVLRDMLSIGLERTPRQDALFSIRELVDIAERALSPGINDPTTAVQCLDALHDLLRSLVRRPFPPPFRRDDGGKMRLMLRVPTWDLFVHTAIDEIRHYGEGSVQVARRLRALLLDLSSIAPPHRRAVLDEQLELLDASIERGFHTAADKRHARRLAADDSVGV